MSFKIFQQEALNRTISVATRLAVCLSLTQTQEFLPRLQAMLQSPIACGLLPIAFRSGSLQRLRTKLFYSEKCPTNVTNVARIPDTLEIHRIALHTSSKHRTTATP